MQLEQAEKRKLTFFIISLLVKDDKRVRITLFAFSINNVFANIFVNILAKFFGDLNTDYAIPIYSNMPTIFAIDNTSGKFYINPNIIFAK